MEQKRSLSSAIALSLFCLLLSINTDRVKSLSESILDDICADKQVTLAKISSTRKLIEESRTTDNEACVKFKNSLVELDDILEIVQSGKICNLDLVDKIRKYKLKFLAPNNNKLHDKIPKSLKQFFISLCFQISAECKMALINNLQYDTKDKLTEEDYDEIRFLEIYGVALLDSAAEVEDFEDILLLNDLQDTPDSEQETGETRVLIKVKTGDMARELVKKCAKKFRPFYEKLILPLIKLSNLGYNYQGELLERELKELRENALVRRWYNIVQTCEVFRSLQIYEDPNMVKLSDGRQALTFITSEEAKLLREKNLKTIEEKIEEEEKRSGDSDAIVYEPIASHNDDELWIKDQTELERLVNKYEASSSEAKRAQWRLYKKMMKTIKENIDSRRVLVFACDVVKSGFTRGESTVNINEDLILMLDQAVEQDEIERGEAHPEDEDGAVAGPREIKAKRKIVSKKGPVSHVRRMGCPSRAKMVRFQTDGTKTASKLLDFGRKFLPKRANIFAWILFIVGTLLVVIAIFHG